MSLSENTPAPAFFRIRDVLRITSLSRPTLYRRIAARRFPRPVHLGGRACGWSSAALQKWISDPEGYLAPEAVGSLVSRKRGRPRNYPVHQATEARAVTRCTPDPVRLTSGEARLDDRPMLACRLRDP